MRSSVRRVEELYQDRVDFHLLNTDDVANQPLAMQYRITGIPTIILLDAQGEVVDMLVGFQTEDQLIAALNRLLESG